MQERQLPPSSSESLTPTERNVLGRMRARRVHTFGFAWGASVLALFAIGCPEPGDLANPGQYTAPAKGGAASTTGGSSAGGNASGNPCEVACVNAMFQKDQNPCLLCHSKTSKLGDLDLESAGYTARLKNQPAKHTGITGATTDCPTGDKLIDTTTPANSWLLKKIHNEQKTCGTVMPQSGMLTADQTKCLETYVACVAPGGAAPGTGGSGGTGGT